jgi:hypothetical protein
MKPRDGEVEKGTGMKIYIGGTLISSIAILFDGAGGLKQGGREPGTDEFKRHCSKESRSLTLGIWDHK